MSLVKLFPMSRVNRVQVLLLALLFSTIGFMLFQYIPAKNPSAQIPEVPVLLLLLLVTPFLYWDIYRNCFRFLQKPREGQFLYCLGLSREQRVSLVSQEVKRALSMLTLFSTLSVVGLLLLSLVFVPEDMRSMVLFALIIGVEHLLGRFIIGRVISGTMAKPVLSDTTGAAVHKPRFSMRVGSLLIRYCLSPLSLWSNGDVRAIVQRFWLYTFRMVPVALPLSFLSLLGGSLFLILLIGNSAEIPPIVSVSIPVFAMVALLSLLFNPIKEVMRSTDSVHYFSFSSLQFARGLLFFLSVLMMPFLMLLCVPLFVSGADIMVCINAMFALLILGLLFMVVEVKSWQSSEVPLWYVPTIIFTLLTMTLSWGGTVVLSVMIGSLLWLLFGQKEKPLLSV